MRTGALPPQPVQACGTPLQQAAGGTGRHSSGVGAPVALDLTCSEAEHNRNLAQAQDSAASAACGTGGKRSRAVQMLSYCSHSKILF